MDSRLEKKALVLSTVTVGYNVLEGVVSILAGMSAGSIALVGFGLDSFIESLSGGIMIWRFRRHETLTRDEEKRIERKAARLVGSTFFVLAAYVLYESVHKLSVHEAVHPSIVGIIIAVFSLIFMPVLFYLKHKTGIALNSRSLIADSKQTLACMFMSAALLIGLGLNYLFGFWQADPIAGLVIVLFLLREGYEALEGEEP